MRTFNVNDYIKFAQRFVEEHYQIDFSIPIKRNNRLSASLGRFVYSNRGASHIDLAGFLLVYGDPTVVIDVLKHECIHYALYEQGLPHEDGNPLFEAELKKHHVSSTFTRKVGKYMIFKCSQCHKRGETRNNRLIKRPQNYLSTCCKGRLLLVEEKIYDGTHM